MSRLARKNRLDIVFVNKGGLMDFFDNQMKSLYRVNDKEYDYILNIACSDEEKGDDRFMGLLVNEKPTFSESKELLIRIDSHLENYYKTLG